MNSLAAKLHGIKTHLGNIHHSPWSNVEAWIAKVRPLLRTHFADHMEDFDALAKPRWATTIYISEAADTAVNKANETIAENAKQSLLGFIDGLIEIADDDTPRPLKRDKREQHGGSVHYTNNFHNSNVGAVASGHGAAAHGSVNTTITQEQHRERIKNAQKALVEDQDALAELGAGIYEALGQFLRIAREIQVENRGVAETQKMMKDALDDLWVKQAVDEIRPKLPPSLMVIKELSNNNLMIEAVKYLVGVPAP